MDETEKLRVCAEQYADLRESSDRLSYEEYQAKKDEIVGAAADAVRRTKSDEEIRAEWFVDYGTMNGWDAETSFRFAVASVLHTEDAKNHPELHNPAPWKYNWSCWYEDNCTCGLRSSCDSSG